jgi:hypothetical protein
LKIGEIVNQIVGAGKSFAAKFYPGEDGDPVIFDALPELLEKATAEHDNTLRSAARGGAKLALAMTAAWYPEADIHQVTEYFPTEDENSQAIVMQDVLRSVRGYATRVANMVDIRKFYKEHPDPHVAVADPSLADPEASRGEEGEAGSRQAQPQGWRSQPQECRRQPPGSLHQLYEGGNPLDFLLQRQHKTLR